jgi:hypothetical protein
MEATGQPAGWTLRGAMAFSRRDELKDGQHLPQVHTLAVMAARKPLCLEQMGEGEAPVALLKS